MRRTFLVKTKPVDSIAGSIRIQADSCSVSAAGDLLLEERVYFKQERTKDLIHAMAAGTWIEASTESSPPRRCNDPMKKTTHFLTHLISGACMVLPLASFAQDASAPKGMVNIRALQAAAADPAKAKNAPGVTTLAVAIPSASVSASDSSLYRSGYERELLNKACGRIIAVKCVTKVVEEDPRTTPLMTLSGGPSGVDAFIWGGEVRMNDKAMEAALFDAMDSMAASGELTKLKYRFMKMDRAWPKPLAVGTDAETLAEAKGLCAKIHAKCTFVTTKDFKGLAKRFDAGELQWVAHSQSWLFEGKDLEDRLTMPVDGVTKAD